MAKPFRGELGAQLSALVFEVKRDYQKDDAAYVCDAARVIFEAIREPFPQSCAVCGEWDQGNTCCGTLTEDRKAGL